MPKRSRLMARLHKKRQSRPTIPPKSSYDRKTTGQIKRSRPQGDKPPYRLERAGGEIEAKRLRGLRTASASSRRDKAKEVVDEPVAKRQRTPVINRLTAQEQSLALQARSRQHHRSRASSSSSATSVVHAPLAIEEQVYQSLIRLINRYDLELAKAVSCDVESWALSQSSTPSSSSDAIDDDKGKGKALIQDDSEDDDDFDDEDADEIDSGYRSHATNKALPHCHEQYRLKIMATLTGRASERQVMRRGSHLRLGQLRLSQIVIKNLFNYLVSVDRQKAQQLIEREIDSRSAVLTGINQLSLSIDSDTTYSPHGSMICPTGYGKTISSLFLSLGLRQPSKAVLYVVPSENLLQQTAREADKHFITPTGKVRVAFIGGKHPSKRHEIANADVIITTYQSLVRESFDKKNVLPRVGSVVLDEAHKCLSKRLIGRIKQMKQAGIIVMGYTATPELSKVSGHNDVRQELPTLFEVDYPQAIADKVLVPIVSIEIPVDKISLQKEQVQQLAKLEHAPTSVGVEEVTLDENTLQDATDITAFYDVIADMYLYANSPVSNKPLFDQVGIVFCATQAQANKVADYLNDLLNEKCKNDAKLQAKRAKKGKGFKFAHSIHGKSLDSDTWIKRHQNGLVGIVCTVRKLEMGYDGPDGFVFNLVPTGSPATYIQRAGRAIRPSEPGKICTVIDFNYPVLWQQKFARHYSREGHLGLSDEQVKQIRRVVKRQAAVGMRPQYRLSVCRQREAIARPTPAEESPSQAFLLEQQQRQRIEALAEWSKATIDNLIQQLAENSLASGGGASSSSAAATPVDRLQSYRDEIITQLKSLSVSLVKSANVRVGNIKKTKASSSTGFFHPKETLRIKAQTALLARVKRSCQLLSEGLGLLSQANQVITPDTFHVNYQLWQRRVTAKTAVSSSSLVTSDEDKITAARRLTLPGQMRSQSSSSSPSSSSSSSSLPATPTASYDEPARLVQKPSATAVIDDEQQADILATAERAIYVPPSLDSQLSDCYTMLATTFNQLAKKNKVALTLTAPPGFQLPQLTIDSSDEEDEYDDTVLAIASPQPEPEPEQTASDDLVSGEAQDGYDEPLSYFDPNPLVQEIEKLKARANKILDASVERLSTLKKIEHYAPAFQLYRDTEKYVRDLPAELRQSHRSAIEAKLITIAQRQLALFHSTRCGLWKVNSKIYFEYLLTKQNNKPLGETCHHITPLHLAAKFGFTDLVQGFLDCCEDKRILTHRSTRQPYTPIDYAARGGHESTVEILFKELPFRIVKKKDAPYLNFAITKGNTDLVIFLLTKVDPWKDTSIFYYACRFENMAIIRLLLQKAPDSFYTNNPYLVQFGHLEGCKDSKVREYLVLLYSLIKNKNPAMLSRTLVELKQLDANLLTILYPQLLKDIAQYQLPGIAYEILSQLPVEQAKHLYQTIISDETLSDEQKIMDGYINQCGPYKGTIWTSLLGQAMRKRNFVMVSWILELMPWSERFELHKVNTLKLAIDIKDVEMVKTMCPYFSKDMLMRRYDYRVWSAYQLAQRKSPEIVKIIDEAIKENDAFDLELEAIFGYSSLSSVL